MFIQGLQKMTLLDYPEHVACTVFLGGCDFRCPFCHNFEFVTGKLSEEAKVFRLNNNSVVLSAAPQINETDFFHFLDKRKGLLDGVAITGGEPCLRHNLPDFIAKIKDKGFLVKLDTNGNHPDMLAKLIREHLIDYVAMDIKNSPKKYAETVGLMALDLDPIKESIGILIKGIDSQNSAADATEEGSAGLDSTASIDYEFRTTVVNEYHTEDDFIEIGELIREAKKYFLQPFVDREHVPNHSLTTPSIESLNTFRDIIAPYVDSAVIRGVEA